MVDREDVKSDTTSDDFLAELSKQLNAHLRKHDWTQVDAAVKIGEDKQRVNNYFLGNSMPNAEMLYLMCVKLGFALEYNGYRIAAKPVNGRPKAELPERQMTFTFDRQFNLTEDNGAVAVKVRRPPGRIELSVSVKADTS